MSLSDILGSALSGMNAAQAGLRSASNNIANVNTPGYARERVSLQAGVTAGRVSGVLVGEPERVADRFLEANVYRRSGDWGRADAVATYLDRLQTMLGAPGADGGLPARIDAIGAAAVAMTGSVAGEQTVRSFVTNVQDALNGLQQLDRDVTALRTDVEGEVGFAVQSINDLLRRIDTLNESVARQSAMGRASGGATDLRMTAVEELSGYLKINVREGTDGRLTIETAGGVTLLDNRLRQLSYPAGTGVSQPLYPPIGIRLAGDDGSLGAATGEQLDSPAVGGKLGGLLELRDRLLPDFGERLGTLFGGLAESLNAVSNAGTTVPAPPRLEGGTTGLSTADRLGFTEGADWSEGVVGSNGIGTAIAENRDSRARHRQEGGTTGLSTADRLGFTGRVTVAVLGANGTLAARTTIDFDALGAGATLGDAVAAINAGLGGAATASFNNGRLILAATAPGSGVAVAQDPMAPSARAGIGFAHYFGLNDLVAGPGTMTPSGFTSGSPLGAFGSFALDGRGRLAFTPAAAIPTAAVSITSDSTDRMGTGRSFFSLMGLSGESSGLDSAAVRADILASAQRLPLARLKTDALPGERAIGAGDNRGATAFVDQLRTAVDLGRGRVASMESFASQVLGRAGMDAAEAANRLTDMDARRSEAIHRRDSYSGVNMDQELAQLMVLQNSYSAAARVMSTASQMYDTLLGMVQS